MVRKGSRRQKRGSWELKPKHIELARTELMPEVLPEIRPGQTAEEIVEEAFACIERMGLKIVRRRRDGPGVTMLLRVYLPDAFWETSPAKQASWIRHELVHVYQWRVYNAFALRWAFNARWRCAFEIQAGREGMRVIQHLNPSEALLRKMAAIYAGEYSDAGPDSTYRLGALHQERTFELAERLLLDAVGLTPA